VRAMSSRAAFVGLLALVALLGPPGTAGAADDYEKFAVESVSASLSDRQAGAHADMTIGVHLTRDGNNAYAKARDLEIELPPGMLGNTQAIPRCTAEELGDGPKNSACPFESQVGITLVRVAPPFSDVYKMPVYNMVPPKGTDIVARLGFIAVGWPVVVNVRIDPVDYSVVATAEAMPAAAGISEATTTLWGVPSDPVHDKERITPQESLGGDNPGGRSVTARGPFLSNPTDCSLAREVRVTARSYQLPDQPSTMTAPFPEFSGCGKLAFAPTFTAVLSNPEAAAPSGLETELRIPQNESPQGLATSTLKSARVTLPEGVTINPAAGDGLEACSAEQVRYGLNVDAACPDAAKIGSIEVDVPALEETLHGSVYQRTPEPSRLFGFWVVADGQGVHLKLPARIEPNAITGQLSTVFDGIESLGGLPQVPFSSLKLRIFGGPRAPLATPSRCGSYLTSYSLAPWSGQPPVEGATPMEVTGGCAKGGFSPQLWAGSLAPFGGAHAPFAFTLTRSDGQDNLAKIDLRMPQGLLAKLAGVPLCPEAAAATGACPSASRLGSIAAAAGVGGAPLWLPQAGTAPTAAYLAGPYKGAPYSVVSVVPGQAGPFDLGTVVNRAAIHIDPKTALARIETDPLPQILEGVPIAYRALQVIVDRPEFMLNPTDCSPKQIRASVLSAVGTRAEPTSHFQVANCAALPFQPRLGMRLVGRKQAKSGGHPGVRALVRQSGIGDAGIREARVTLPRSLALDPDNAQALCEFEDGTKPDLEHHCPKGSIVGRVRAVTPLLSKPLSGNVYFVKNVRIDKKTGNRIRTLPMIVAALRGQIAINLTGEASTTRAGELVNTFAAVPDAPITRFNLNINGGRNGILVVTETARGRINLCKRPKSHIARTVWSGHNGALRSYGVRVKTPCPKAKSTAQRGKAKRR
jgi:hypothetical protein